MTFYVAGHLAATGSANELHLDAFRIEDARELDALALDDARAGDAIVLVEWGDRVTAALPPEETIHVRIELLPEETGRRIRFEYPDTADVE